ncbi:hypothetical protein ES703_113243 [subsurface metagenome]
MGCTTVVAVPQATKDGEIYLLWNFDILRPAKLIFDRFRMFVASSEGYSYVAWGIPGWLHIPLMNEKGLCFVGNAVGMTDGGAKGTTIWEIVEKALTSCSTVEEVFKLYSDSDRLALLGFSAAIFANFNSIYADEQGGAVTIEYSKNHIAVRHVDELGVMVETNHHQYLDRKLSGSADPSKQKAITGSYARLGRAWEMAKDYSGQFDLEAMMRFASDHEQNYSLLSDYEYEVPETGLVDDSTICCHLWNSGWYLRKLRLKKAVKAMLEGETLYSFILQPKQRTVWFCQGKPCRSRYVRHEFGEALEKSRGKKPVKQRLLRGKTRSLAVSMLRLAERAIPV